TVENAGTYFLAGKELVAEEKVVNEKPQTVKNPNTSDVAPFVASMLALIGATSLIITLKKSMKKN
ncbi:MAG: hypothetical protein RR751_07015, partial [Clostridia bacterium]